ncbi:hypothetical protein [Microbispora sp. H10836]|uniref:hypothetical protein n=1 Tax=Microbispora sp. H10836 TaxID=2729106 RepID=UPI0014735017|nr:hypothetical protein [Microbispora sp. H10836]
MAASIDIVIRSYHRDRHWLALALRSVELFVTGQRNVVVVIPETSASRMDTAPLRDAPGVRLRLCPGGDDDYLGQQLTKLHADLLTDADLIVHLDSDQVFVQPCDLRERLWKEGRPWMAFSGGDRRPPRDGWRRSPAAFYGRPVHCDLATPLPLAVPRHVYGAVREHSLVAHGVPIAEYARRAGAGRFSEAALLRGHALLFEPERYAWVDVRDADPLPECLTFWSRAETPASAAHRLPGALAEQALAGLP